MDTAARKHILQWLDGEEGREWIDTTEYYIVVNGCPLQLFYFRAIKSRLRTERMSSLSFSCRMRNFLIALQNEDAYYRFMKMLPDSVKNW